MCMLKDFIGCEGELNREKEKKKKLFGVAVLILDLGHPLAGRPNPRF